MELTKYDVFISYSRKDYVDEHKNVIPSNEVSKIKEALTKAGITYWFDEEGVYSGNEFAKIIVRSIKASKVFVFLSTENSNQSEWTASEISTAYMLKKKIIPVRIDDSVYHDDVILYISRLSHIDYNENPEKGRKELIRSINSYLAEEKMAEAQKIAEEKRRLEELDRQRKQQEEEKKRQEKIAQIETEIAALEAQKTEREKTVLQKEQELKLAQVDLKACETKIQKIQLRLEDLKNPLAEIVAPKKVEDTKRKAEEETIKKTVENTVQEAGKNTWHRNNLEELGQMETEHLSWKNAVDEYQTKIKSLKDKVLIPININGKYGFADESGKVVIPCQWVNVGMFSEGLAKVMDINGNWGYINKIGNVVVPCKWMEALAFSNGLALVKDENFKWWKIDTTGKVVGKA